jgi:hypothetical protein
MRGLSSSVAIAGLAAVLASCGGSDDIASCTISTPDEGGGTLTVCREIAELPPAEQEFWANSCVVSAKGATASFKPSPCPHALALGGCRLTEQTITFWYYAGGPYEAADVPMLCAQLGATVVAP